MDSSRLTFPESSFSFGTLDKMTLRVSLSMWSFHLLRIRKSVSRMSTISNFASRPRS